MYVCIKYVLPKKTFWKVFYFSDGEVAEWSKALVLKTSEKISLRGFDSRLLRSFWLYFFLTVFYLQFQITNDVNYNFLTSNRFFIFGFFFSLHRSPWQCYVDDYYNVCERYSYMYNVLQSKCFKTPLLYKHRNVDLH